MDTQLFPHMPASLFLSHGSPDLVLKEVPARQFLAALGQSVPRPKALLVVSAHFETARPAVTAAASPPTIHDFHGFPEQLYRLRYPAPGAPHLASRVAELLRGAGFECDLERERGFDHGCWSPLMLAWPLADIPVVQLSVQPEKGAAHHIRLGRALEPLAGEGVLVIGSGSLTHDLRSFFATRGADDMPPPSWVSEFADWIFRQLEAGDEASLADYRARAPHAARNHPTDEHLLPLFVAFGAAGKGPRSARIHASSLGGVLRLDSYAFEAAAA
ncbi:MAG TPA: class III extradiol ring-cleavage dioxygenase [Hyphomicrobiales bacterium]|nr:class III extradiol ring-cleavage dioxygenase [Hyphomicrobiales bacterium]